MLGHGTIILDVFPKSIQNYLKTSKEQKELIIDTIIDILGSLNSRQYLKITTNQSSSVIQIFIWVINNGFKKCVVINNEYRFNSKLIKTLTIPIKKHS